MNSLPSFIVAASGHLHKNSELSFRTYYVDSKPIIQRYVMINPFRGKASAAVQATRRRLSAANAYAIADYAIPARRARWEQLMRLHNAAAARLRKILGVEGRLLNKHNDPTHELRDYNMVYYYITAFYARAMALAEQNGSRLPLRLIVQKMLHELLVEYQPLAYAARPAETASPLPDLTSAESALLYFLAALSTTRFHPPLRLTS